MDKKTQAGQAKERAFELIEQMKKTRAIKKRAELGSALREVVRQLVRLTDENNAGKQK